MAGVMTLRRAQGARMNEMYDRDGIRLYHGDVLERLRELPDESVHCMVTSPPYWGLRDYGVEGQIGLEATPEAFVERMVEVFHEVRRVLRADGTCWVNMGDGYAQGGRGGIGDKSTLQGSQRNQNESRAEKVPQAKRPAGLKPKDLIGMPWRVAFALQADGWWLRSEIIWHKPNPMPESCTDRPTSAHEKLFLLTKSARYFYDAEAVRTAAKESSLTRLSQDIENQAGSTRANGGGKTNGTMKAVGGKPARRYGDDKQSGHGRRHAGFNARWDSLTSTECSAMGANLRNVWTITTRPFKEAHFATFPPEIPERCIKAGCPEGGTVLDPFMGSGTTAVVAWQLGRECIGIDLSEEYLTTIAIPRIERETAQQRLFEGVG